MGKFIDDILAITVAAAGIIGMVGIPVAVFWAWFLHVITCINAASYILLAIGLIVPPIGWAHGFAIWFGWM